MSKVRPEVGTGASRWHPDGPLSRSARLVAGQLAENADGGSVTLPLDQLARRCCLSPVQTGRALDELAELGWLVQGPAAVHLMAPPKTKRGAR